MQLAAQTISSMSLRMIIGNVNMQLTLYSSRDMCNRSHGMPCMCRAFSQLHCFTAAQHSRGQHHQLQKHAWNRDGHIVRSLASHLQAEGTNLAVAERREQQCVGACNRSHLYIFPCSSLLCCCVILVLLILTKGLRKDKCIVCSCAKGQQQQVVSDARMDADVHVRARKQCEAPDHKNTACMQGVRALAAHKHWQTQVLCASLRKEGGEGRGSRGAGDHCGHHLGSKHEHEPRAGLKGIRIPVGTVLLPELLRLGVL